MIEIREYRASDAPALRNVFYRAIRETASAYYSLAQVSVWASDQYDPAAWRGRMDGISPFIAEVDGVVAGYADLNPVKAAEYCHVIDNPDYEWGYIDHFFVSPDFGRQGVGNALMTAIHEKAARLELHLLQAHVSLAAQGFFERWGFTVVQQEFIERLGVTLERHYMEKRIS